MKTLKITVIIIMAFTTIMNAQLVNQETGTGEKEGKWVKYFGNNKIKYEGQFHLNKPYGKFTYYYKDGNVKSINEFSNNGTIADNTTYYAKGNVMAEGKFVNQKKDGVWKYYLDEKSNPLASSETYIDGVLNGESVTYYPDSGNISEIVYFKGGKKNGELLKYFPDGTLMTKSYYKDGMPDGDFIHYHMNGKVQIIGSYLNGLEVGEWKYYDKDGNEIDESEFKKQSVVKSIE